MSFKSKTNEVLLREYKSKGYEFAIDLCRNLMITQYRKIVKDQDDLNEITGEIAETVLEIAVSEYMKRNSEKTASWFYSKGLILKDPENAKGKFLTELDFTLFTPQTIVAFECKSYRGVKVIVDKCTIKREGRKDFDVFSQHYNHIDVLLKTLSPFRIKKHEKGTIYCRPSLFDFSPGTLLDKREEKYKALMPVTTVENIWKLLDAITGQTLWNIDPVRRAVDVIQKSKASLVSKHLQYVKSIRK